MAVGEPVLFGFFEPNCNLVSFSDNRKSWVVSQGAWRSYRPAPSGRLQVQEVSIASYINIMHVILMKTYYHAWEGSHFFRWFRSDQRAGGPVSFEGWACSETLAASSLRSLRRLRYSAPAIPAAKKLPKFIGIFWTSCILSIGDRARHAACQYLKACFIAGIIMYIQKT